MSIEILHRYTGAILYMSDVSDVRVALVEAVGSGADLRWADLREADLRGANLSGADLREADLRGANLSGADLPPDFRIASLCWGGWGVTVTPAATQIGCETHPNADWLGWAVDAPEIAVMHQDAAAWWRKHRESVCAVIRDVMQEG